MQIEHKLTNSPRLPWLHCPFLKTNLIKCVFKNLQSSSSYNPAGRTLLAPAANEALVAQQAQQRSMPLSGGFGLTLKGPKWSKNVLAGGFRESSTFSCAWTFGGDQTSRTRLDRFGTTLVLLCLAMFDSYPHCGITEGGGFVMAASEC